MTGIYCIENLINGKKYIGQAVDIAARWRHHRCLLDKGKHHSIALQRAWNKYSDNNFKFYVLEECEAESLSDCEIKWIKQLDTYKHGYNMTAGGEGQLGRPQTPEQRKHLSEINMGPLNPNYGLKRSLETRQKMSIAMSHKRKPLSDAHKQKISEQCKNVDHSSQNKAVLWIEQGMIYKSLSEAAEMTGYSISGISKVCLGKRRTIHNQHFIFKEV